MGWILVLLFCAFAEADSSFVAIPAEKQPQYHIDFARHFFAGAEVEKTDRANLDSAIKELENLKGKLSASAGQLLRALQLYDKIQMQYMRHYSYLYLRYATNTQDETSLKESSDLDAMVNQRTAFFQKELIDLDRKTLDRFAVQKPDLKKYFFAIDSLQRSKPHTLTLKEEELLDTTAPFNLNWQYELYEKVIALTNFGTVKTKDGDLNVWKDRRDISANPDPAVREEGFRKRYNAFASQRDLYAFILLRLVGARQRLAQIRHFDDAPASAYFERYWTEAEVSHLLEELAQRAALYKRYQTLRAEHVRKMTGYREVNLWDMSAQPAQARRPQFTIDEARRIICEALAPLGPGYGKEIGELLDPNSGRMDIVPGANRKSGGFSQGFIGMDSVFYSSGFAGAYDDVRLLTHESTHAVHRQLMTRNQVLPAYGFGPNYLFEAFAILNEFLLADYLYDHETDPFRKQYFLEQFLEGKGTVMFVAGFEALLEQSVYQGVAQGKIHGANDLDLITKQVYSRFSIWPEKEDELKNQWMMIPLMYEDPFYDINYVYGSILALKFYHLYRRDPAKFADSYIALMENGFDAPPGDLLRRFLNIDLKDPNLLSDALQIVEEKVNRLEQIYKIADPGAPFH